MKLNRFELKQSAKQLLRSNFRTCVLTALVISIISLVLLILETRLIPTIEIPESTWETILESTDPTAEMTALLQRSFTLNRGIATLLLAFVSLMATAPGLLGAYGIYQKLAGGREADVSDLKTWYFTGRLILKSIAMWIVTELFTLLWAALIVWLPIVVITVLMIAVAWMGSIGLTLLLAFVMMAVSIAGAILLVVVTGHYTTAMYLIGEDPELGILESIRGAKKLLKGRRWQFFGLRISFILWELLSMITMGIAEIYVMPYRSLTFSLYFNRLRCPQEPIIDGTEPPEMMI